MSARKVQYLVRRQGIYQLRLPIPKDLQRIFDRQDIQRTLKSSDFPTARRLALRAASDFAELCASIRAMPTTITLNVPQLIESFFSKLIAQASLPSPVHPDFLQKELYDQERIVDDMQTDLDIMRAHRNFSPDVKLGAIDLAKEASIPFESLSDGDQAQLCEGIIRAQSEYLHYMLHRQRSLIDPYIPKDTLFAGTQLQLGAPSNATNIANTNGSGGTLAKRVDEYLSSAECKPCTVNEKRGVLNWFQEFALPDTDVRQITHAHILQFKTIVSELRKNAATSLPLDAARTDDAANRIHPKTAKKKFDTVKTFLRWLVEIGALHTAPGMLIQYKVPKTAASKKRRPFLPAELDQLFSSPLFAGCKSKSQRHVPGELILRDDLFWMPLVLLYTGMRLAEPLQIAAQDVHIDENHPFFDLDSTKVALKQEVSDRLVPIHPDLIELGFGDFVRKRQKTGPAERLFRGIKSKGDVWNYYSKVLGRYIDRVGLTDPRLVAHSFRHSFKDTLRNAAVPEGEQHFLMGHSNSEAAHNYGSGSKIDVLYNWIEKLNMGLSVQVKTSLTNPD